ncbi:MAG: hypothetical protein LJE83_00870 [Gammaproteobacteria bacterium]|nr:hypothetical protein [Gammaproteobacteria bacterium]
MLRQNYLISIFYLLVIFQLLIPAYATAATLANSYSIVLASAPGKNLNWSPKQSSLLKNYTIYVEKTSVDGAPWERLCVGYFDSRKDTFTLINKIKKTYPGAWVQKTPTKNIVRTLSQGSTKAASRPAPKPAVRPKPAAKVNQSSLSDEKLKSLMVRANTEFKNEDYSAAVRYLTAVIASGQNQYSREALELLGLARQRKGQNSHAVAIYEQYLAAYPEGEGADRVRQRLAGLLTATRAGKEKIDMKTVETRNEIDTYGSISQYYWHNITSTDDIGSITTQSQLISYLDVTTLQKTSRFDHRYQFTADHSYDFETDRDSSELRFIDTYYEVAHRKTGNSGKIGRQSLRIGGILKRFDGLSGGYQITPDMRINALAGYSVDVNNKDSINTDKGFYGFIFETGTFLDHWNMNVFYIDQSYSGLQDSQGIGSEVRYRDSKTAAFGMIDYDLFYNEINIIQLNANLILDHGRTVYVNAYMRKAPLLATSNALIGQAAASIDELKTVYNIEQIHQLAEDRTADSQLITVGGSQSLSKKFDLTGDVTLSRTDGTVASGGVAATPGTGTDLLLSAQLVGNNLLRKNDTGVLGVRYYDMDSSNTISLIANTRFPINREWRINPRLQYDIRNFSADDRSQKKIRLLLRSDYRYLKQARFDFELGYDTISDDFNVNGQSLSNDNLHFMMGYRYDF